MYFLPGLCYDLVGIGPVSFLPNHCFGYRFMMREEEDQIKQKNKLNNWDNCRRNDKLKKKKLQKCTRIGGQQEVLCRYGGRWRRHMKGEVEDNGGVRRMTVRRGGSQR
jgi:hypothetical protein